jgi:hypothetical protein
MQKDKRTLNENLENLKNHLLSTIYCNRLGIIDSFNERTQRANITLVDLPFTDRGEVFSAIPLLDVPLMSQVTAKGGLTFPISQGDKCTVHFDDRNKDSFFVNGEVQKPQTTRKHDKNDCYFTILHPKALNNIIPNYINDAVTLYYQNTILQLKDNRASLKTKKASIAIDDDKIELKNELYNLKTLILNLTAAIKTSAYVDNPAAPTVVVQPHQSFITLITQFEQHLAILLK